jgi:hypothetical protein
LAYPGFANGEITMQPIGAFTPCVRLSSQMTKSTSTLLDPNDAFEPALA